MPDQPSIQQLLSEATAHYHSGDYRQAIEAWQRVLASEPGNQRAQEGIRMASLLQEEAQSAAESAPDESGPAATDQEASSNIAKVREGIQKVREYLGSSRHLEAMEVCQSLLALAPRSAAVHEVVDEAREAYEAQPFINEHLEIARQLFVQERLDEATTELHKIFFLNANHGEARKLEAKILALRQKRVPGAVPTESLAGEDSVPAEPAAGPAEDAGSAEPGASPTPPDFGDAIDLPQEPVPVPESLPPEAPAANVKQGEGADGSSPGESWEAELAQLDLGGAQAAPAGSEAIPLAVAGEEEQDHSLPLMDLSENPAPPKAVPEAARKSGAPAPSAEIGPSVEKGSGDLDLSLLLDQETELRVPPGMGAAREHAEEVSRRPLPHPVHAAPPRRSQGSPLLKYLLPLLGIVIGGGAAWWYLGVQSASSGGGAPPGPPPARAQRLSSAAGPQSSKRGGGANLGLSSSGSRTTGGTASAGVSLPDAGTPSPAEAPPLSPDQARRDIARYTDEGRSLMQRGKYREAVKAFSKVLDLDPANMEAKDQMDQASAKVLEQKKLEEDLQTGKEFFVEKDYESALRKFYRLPRDRNLGDLNLYIRNAWYDWAVVAMKGGNCVDALQRLKEALALDPDDPEALKQQEVADHYKDQPKDHVYYAFTDRLTYRTLDQK